MNQLDFHRGIRAGLTDALSVIRAELDGPFDSPDGKAAADRAREAIEKSIAANDAILAGMGYTAPAEGPAVTLTPGLTRALIMETACVRARDALEGLLGARPTSKVDEINMTPDGMVVATVRLQTIAPLVSTSAANLCPRCSSDKPAGADCPSCGFQPGFDDAADDPPQAGPDVYT